MVVVGTAFGVDLFDLMFSLLPKKVQSLVCLLGIQRDRAVALRALAMMLFNTLQFKQSSGYFHWIVLRTVPGGAQ
ncbi:hypothetical protein DFH07DRAFT_294244 [Mycena maculata]|uniref:Uncharacterized protein n=1 Tax=Mycena maculata TaxID=230809 RepID=A0AAD7MLU4_9AGAR|nr:hypothetical protein DFH07DRAFT_294244 [Mycena maculata]